MNRYKTTGLLGGLFCLLVATCLAGGALGMTPAQMETLSPFYASGTHDLFKVEFIAVSSTEVEVEGFEWDTGTSAWVSLGALPANIIDGYFGGGAASELEFVPASTNALEVHIGTTGGDNIGYGGRSGVLVLALEGDDVIDMDGQAAPVVCYAGEGQNIVYGGLYDDTLLGGSDIDEIYGDDGDDYIHGDQGDDFLEGGDGSDTINGHFGSDEIHGDDSSDPDSTTVVGADYIIGGNNNSSGTTWGDVIFGDDGNDAIDGGSGIDELYGGGGDDYLHDRDGTDNNELWGNAGSDWLHCFDTGDDYANGGGGTNFLFVNVGDTDVNGSTPGSHPTNYNPALPPTQAFEDFINSGEFWGGLVGNRDCA